jgi:hypothetical protein
MKYSYTCSLIRAFKESKYSLDPSGENQLSMVNARQRAGFACLQTALPGKPIDVDLPG